MDNLSDQQLIGDYARHRSEAAFAELARRHVDLAYSAAVRIVRDPHLAKDITQGVFLALAQNAPQLTNRAVIAGWLHLTTRNLAVKTIRSDARRRAREQEAAAMNEPQNQNTDDAWKNIAPQLDDALVELSEADRDAVMLRYFQRKSAEEMAEILGISADAAQKRVSRAIERLQDLFARRGVAVGAGGLIAAVCANAVQSAPAGLAATISTAGAGAATSTSTIVNATKTLAMTTTQKIVMAAIVAACIGTPLIFQQSVHAKLETQRELLRQQTDRLNEAQAESVALSNRLASARATAALPQDELAELLRLRSQAGSLRNQVEAAAKSGKTRSRADLLASMTARYNERISQIKEMLETNPGEKIPELQYLTPRNWLDLAWSSENETNFAKTASTARGWAENAFMNDYLYPALQQYAQQNNNAFPTDLSQLKPYFTGTVDDATLQRWEIVPANQLAPYMTQQALGQGEDELIAPKTPVNTELDMPTVCGLSKVTAFAGRPPNVWVRAQ